MQSFDESHIEYGDFVFDCQKVVCYGMCNNAGGTTTVLNFPTPDLARAFDAAYLAQSPFEIYRNDAQLICLADYDTVMRRSDSDPRVRSLNYNRDFMMGTLAHLS